MKKIISQLAFLLIISFNVFSQSHTISGYFLYDNVNHSPLDSVVVYLVNNGVKIDSTVTLSNGFYQFLNVPDGNYNITGKTNKPWEFANYTDVIAIRSHFVGSDTTTFSSLRLHSSDVYQTFPNSGINGSDIVKLTQRVSGITSSFNRGDWVFEKPFGGDTVYVSSYLNDTVIVNGNNVSQNFLGRCTGDVNYNVSTDFAGITTIGSDTACPGTIISIPLTLTNSPEIIGLTLRLEYDASVLSFRSCSYTSSNIFGSSPNLNPIQTDKDQNTKKLIILTGASLDSSIISGEICNLNFMYYGGTTAITFINSAMESLWCEYVDTNSAPLYDLPTNNYYVNGFVTQYDTAHSSLSFSVSATKLNLCSPDIDTLIVSGSTLSNDASRYWYSGTCPGNFIGSGDIVFVSPSSTTTYFTRVESPCYTTSCLTITINVTPFPQQPGQISGNEYPNPGSVEIYSVPNVPGTTYSWSAPSGWVGFSTANSITFIADSLNSGVISIIPSNSCGTGPARTLNVIVGYVISGYFNYDNLNYEILDSVKVFLNLNGNKIDSTITDLNGFYRFPGVSNGIYTITATTNKPWGNVNIIDILYVIRYFVGDTTLTSSIRLHAADVSRNYGINTTDAVQIRQKLAYDRPFAAGEWVFEKPYGGDTIDVAHYLNDTVEVNMNNINQNFLGRCIGDVNYNTTSGTAGITTIASDTACAGTIIQIPVVITNSLHLYATSVRLDYDGSVLSFHSIYYVNPASFPYDTILSQHPFGSNYRYLILEQGFSGCLVVNSKILCFLNFMYYGGTSTISFNNSFMGGHYCENIDSNLNILIDNPTANHYVNGLISEYTFSLPAISASASQHIVCEGVYDTLSIYGGLLGFGSKWAWRTDSCSGTLSGSGDTLVVTPSLSKTYYVRAESPCSSTSCVSVSVNVLNLPLQPDTIIGNNNPVINSTESYSVSQVAGISYTWSVPSGWTGFGTMNSISVIVSKSNGVISVIPSNACGNGITRTLDVSTYSSVSGNITYDNTFNTPIDSAKVYLLKNGNYIDTTQSDINGFYKFDEVLNGSYNITIKTNKLWGGANATDGVKVKRHFAGTELFTSSLYLHAADVNMSYNINATDAVKISRRFVGTDLSFTRGDWVFEKIFGGDTINVSVYLNDTVKVSGNNVNQDFKALCVGDVNGSYIPMQGAKQPSKIRLNYNESIELGSNVEYDLPFFISGSIKAGAISLILNYPSDLAEIESLKIFDNKSNSNLSYKITKDEIRIGWFTNDSATNLSNGDLILKLRIRTTDNFKHGDIIKFNVKNDPLCEFADESGNPFNNVVLNSFSIKYPEIPTNIFTDEPSGNIISIHPNPANNILYISNAKSSDITIYNLTGQAVLKSHSDSKNFAADISFLSEGTYIIKVVSDKNSVTKKIDIIK